MNDELDVMRRLVDYHDHISAPPVVVADDLQRGRQRVRRRRTRLAGGVALGLASVVAAVSLVTGGGPAERSQPVGPPTSTSTSDPTSENPGLKAPLVAPESILEVRELGFHVEGMPTVGGRLLRDRQLIEVAVANASFAVEVYYQGSSAGLLATDRPRQEVSIHGIAGTLVERYENGGLLVELIWEYAPDAWATVQRWDGTSMPSRKAQVLAIAEAIRPGGPAVRVPFRVGRASDPILENEAVAEVGMFRNRRFWGAVFESGLSITGNPSDLNSACGPQPTSSRFVQAFTYRGYAGCLQGTGDDESQVDAVILHVDGTNRAIRNYGSWLTAYEIEDLKQLLVEVTVAPSDDPATWFDLTTALGG